MTVNEDKQNPLTDEQRLARTIENLAKAELRFAESMVDDVFDRYVDPRDEFEGWSPLDSSSSASWASPYILPYRNETDLADLRNQSRQLCAQNEFAINGVENRISYVVGTGHTYSVNAKADAELPEGLADDVTAEIDDFIERNKWHTRQQEIVRRRDRDGEVFLRFFNEPDGLVVRFVEPEEIKNPPNAEQSSSLSFGIRTKDGDAETPVAYYVNNEPVPAEEIQHRKANVDLVDPRGVPTFYAVRKNLIRAAKLLRNMSTAAEIQTAIALVRKHAKASQAAITQYVSDQKDFQRTRTTSEGGTKTDTYKRYFPGSILDTNADTEYQFPVSGIDVGRFVAGIQAELRAVASRLVMPEFMLTSDASNANYSSTLVSEGPAVKMFERMQAEMAQEDREVLRRVIQLAIRAGRLPANTLELVEIDAETPTVTSRDRLKEVQADQILLNARVMSRETMAARHDLDYEAEREKIEDDLDRSVATFGLPGFGGGNGQRPGDNQNGGDDGQNQNGSGDGGNDPRGGPQPQRPQPAA